MSSLGPYLRELRQGRGISLEEAARVTRVASRYLEALEADDFARLPAPVFIKGFIRAYCQLLEVPADEALTLFQQQLTGTPSPPAPATAPAEPPPEAQPRARGTVLVSFVLLVVLGLALFAVTLALQSGRDSGRPPRAASLATAPPEPAAPEPTQPNEPAITPPAAERQTAAAEPPRAIEPPAAPPDLLPSRPNTPAEPNAAAAVGPISSPYRLVARVSEPTWIRVRTGDGRATEETVPAGEVREWVSNAPFILTVGNAGGVSLELNGRPLPPLGQRGAVIPRLVIPPAEQ